jgi:hypothetical protein
MKKSNDTIGNRTLDLAACSAMPQSTAPPRALRYCAVSKLVNRAVFLYWLVNAKGIIKIYRKVFLVPN